MRLQLTLIAVALAAAPAAADDSDDDVVTTTLRCYADDDHVTVISPAASLGTALGERVRVDTELEIDSVSAASVDVITSASPTTVSELRVDLGARVAYRVRDPLTVRGDVDVSHEHDYDAGRLGLDGRVELTPRGTTLGLHLVVGRDRVRDVGDPGFAGQRDDLEVIARGSQIVDARTVIDAVVDTTWADGWHASPYRRVPVDDPAGPLAISVREATPARRLAAAASLGIRRAVGEAWYASAVLRGYVDDWAIRSATATAALRWQLAERVLVGGELRGYAQQGASFFAPRYQLRDGMAPALRTRDRTLGPMGSAFASLTLDLALGDLDPPHLVLALGELAQWFVDDPRQDRRLASVVTMALAVPWP